MALSDRSPVQIVNCHAEGEVGDVIVGGVDPPPGDSVWEQSRWIARDGSLRDLVLNEPRGGVFRHANLLVPAIDPRAQLGFIIMEPEHTPPMSGSNAMCVATVALNTGILPMTEPMTELVLEAPGGLVRMAVECHDGKAERITIENVPSFTARLDAPLEVAGIGTLTVATAYGGDSFVLVDADALGFAIRPDEAKELAEVGVSITAAANEQLGFDHPVNTDWRHISFCLIGGPIRRDPASGALSGQHTCVIDPGKLDRSPTGTGVSALMAVLHSRGEMDVGEELTMASVIGSTFLGRIVATADVAGTPAIVPSVSGRAWITGTHELTLDPDDPWPRGYRIADTWPAPLPPSPSGISSPDDIARGSAPPEV